MTATAWDTSCPDWERRIRERDSLVPSLPLIVSEADRALRIFCRLRVPDVEGTPTYGELCDAWVLDIVRAVFGSYDPSIRRRMIREFFLLIPKKNGKSSIAAALMVTAAIMNRRPEAELLLIAPTKKIADIAYKQAAGIIRLDTELRKLFHPQTHQRTITHRVTGAALIIKAADTDVITGSKATFILVDETHVFAKKPKAADVFVEIRGALAARSEGFMIQITTQSKEPPAGVFKSELANARDVRDGKLKLPLLPILYELPRDLTVENGWKDPATWSMVNPNLGRSVDEAFLTDELTKAEREGASALALLASQHFNVEIGLGLRTDGWVGAEFWLKRADPSITLETLLERCEVATVGIDGGGRDDLYGICVLGRERETKNWLAWSFATCHEIVLERRKSIASTLRDFESAKELLILSDEVDDVPFAVEIIQRVKDAGILAQVGVDPAGIGELVDALAEIEVTQENKLLGGIRQGADMMNAIKTAERKLASGKLLHCGSGLFRWCVENVKIEPLATMIRATKVNAGDAKIDVAMALFDAVAPMSLNPEPIKIGSVYERRGLRML
ncbi:terminase large subunit [Chenggangzhangella methanolivorans]|uniref:terminase large subunit n=1 Tax=Chenggangzhangella methanolivorans TaxID=1437009 RepID=UPI003619B69F